MQALEGSGATDVLQSECGVYAYTNRLMLLPSQVVDASFCS